MNPDSTKQAEDTFKVNYREDFAGSNELYRRIQDLGVEEVYRKHRLRSDGKPKTKQEVYRFLKMFFPITHTEFCQMYDRIDPDTDTER